MIILLDCGKCVDTDNGKVNAHTFGCDYYRQHPMECSRNLLDTPEFTANSLCCTCIARSKGNKCTSDNAKQYTNDLNIILKYFIRIFDGHQIFLA